MAKVEEKVIRQVSLYDGSVYKYCKSNGSFYILKNYSKILVSDNEKSIGPVWAKLVNNFKLDGQVQVIIQ